MKEIVPGCGNCNSSTAVCEIMFMEGESRPSLAKETMVASPMVIEGPDVSIPGFVCSVSGDPNSQKDCSHFVQRTEEDDLRDVNF